jgi:predicted AlkP superfamily pyrophosphatase or phosphodiesterase
MKRTAALLAILILSYTSFSQKEKGDIHPKLVVGIVIDQMRFDYLYKFYGQYSDNGFRRLMSGGMNFTFARYNYIPTYTGPGHASIYTGTTPYYHGIISNDWYDKTNGKRVYCVNDLRYKTVGAPDSSGFVSPKNLLSTTLTDQLRMADNGLSRVFSVSLKDRAAVLPAGHSPNEVYWYDGKSGNFITSTYYTKELPEWLTAFNGEKIPARLMSSVWDTNTKTDYRAAYPDNGPGEGDPFREGKTTFPHRFDKLTDAEKLEKIFATPFGNELLLDLVLRLIRNDKPGKGPGIDFLAISFSSPDYVGHAYGPNSMEIMDTYVRLDRQLAMLLDTLDRTVGKGNYLLFLTADHGVRPTGAFLKSRNIPAGNIRPDSVERVLKAYCTTRYGNPDLIRKVEDNQVYLDHAVAEKSGIDIASAEENLALVLREKFSRINAILTNSATLGSRPTRTASTFLLNAHNPARSGDISFETAMNGMMGEDYLRGTSHETSFGYDTHVPLIFYGWHIKPGHSNREVFVEDIAPTVSNLIHIQEPDATLGVPLIR